MAEQPANLAFAPPEGSRAAFSPGVARTALRMASGVAEHVGYGSPRWGLAPTMHPALRRCARAASSPSRIALSVVRSEPLVPGDHPPAARNPEGGEHEVGSSVVSATRGHCCIRCRPGGDAADDQTSP